MKRQPPSNNYLNRGKRSYHRKFTPMRRPSPLNVHLNRGKTQYRITTTPMRSQPPPNAHLNRGKTPYNKTTPTNHSKPTSIPVQHGRLRTSMIGTNPINKSNTLSQKTQSPPTLHLHRLRKGGIYQPTTGTNLALTVPHSCGKNNCGKYYDEKSKTDGTNNDLINNHGKNDDSGKNYDNWKNSNGKTRQEDQKKRRSGVIIRTCESESHHGSLYCHPMQKKPALIIPRDLYRSSPLSQCRRIIPSLLNPNCGGMLGTRQLRAIKAGGEIQGCQGGWCG